MGTIGFVGAGTVGTALAITLSGKGYPVSAVASRSKSSADALAARVPGCRALESAQAVADNADLVFITTPDDAIANVAATLIWHAGQGVVHCSGAASLDILGPAARDGAQTGAFHPLQSFANVSRAMENIPGSTFAIEAESPLRETLAEMARAMNGKPVLLKPGDKVLYHTAAVIVSNYTVALMKMATDLWQLFGVSTPEATEALLPLLRGTVNNIASIGLPNCLTGPIARGDIGTVERHLAALEQRAPQLLAGYRELGQHAVDVALQKGKVDQAQAERMLELLHAAMLQPA
ncbi:MAG: DUF2520 domain-containing protein [Chloroflexi bacterium]|nr:DUF2520 domain-containing protein [Chloroflexota bacterium]